MSAITKTPARLAKKVDRLGELNAIIAGFTREAELIKAELKASGLDELTTSKYRAVITTRETARLDSAAVRKILTPAEIDRCTKTSFSTSISLYDL